MSGYLSDHKRLFSLPIMFYFSDSGSDSWYKGNNSNLTWPEYDTIK